ncbi:hypothetical protein ACH5Y9_01065 [Methylomonas sp. BW4-1]|uniref:hypothetical protein n=1 Tax=Methylomonas sp. BW4-1 TaxID=3376685 RepID=UPI0040415101
MSTHNIFRLSVLILVVVGSILYALFKKAEGVALVTSQKQAELALLELQKWGTFLIGLQTGSIGVMGFLFEKVATSPKQGVVSSVNESIANLAANSPQALSSWLYTSGVFALIFFGASILVATWLLGAIPSLMIRTKEIDSVENDVFHMSLFKMQRWPEVGPMTGLQYILFSCGLIMFSIFVYMRVPSSG